MPDCEVQTCDRPADRQVVFESIGVEKWYCPGHIKRLEDCDEGLPPVP